MTRYILLIFGIVQLACTDFGESGPPQVPLQQLLAAPDTLMIAGKSIYLTTYLWRSFMPIIPPDGSPLLGIVYVRTTDSTLPPSVISPDVVWIVCGHSVWTTFLHDPPTPEQNAIAKVFSDGPRWQGPVDVVIRFSDSTGHYHFLRAADQRVGAVY